MPTTGINTMEPIKEVLFDKTYDASIDLVWKVWTDSALLKKWWGPNDVTIPECEVDLKVGGKFYIVMEAGEAMGPYKGTKWPMLAKFTKIEPNSKLFYDAKAWTEGSPETTEIDQVTELTLSEKNGQTKLHLRAAINKVGPGAKMAVEGMQYGFTQQLDKLDTFLKGNK